MIHSTIFRSYEKICSFHDHFESDTHDDLIKSFDVIANSLFLLVRENFVDADTNAFEIVFFLSFSQNTNRNLKSSISSCTISIFMIV
jgi:hypothetical protein